ncbi:MAG: hypothetical protein WC371_00295 [Parachlamydiales bacterium]|jgi:hypothetical protein
MPRIGRPAPLTPAGPSGSGEKKTAPSHIPLSGKTLKKAVIGILKEPFSTFGESSGQVWQKLCLAKPDFAARLSAFLNKHEDKFKAIQAGKTWESLKEELKEKMGKKLIYQRRQTASWEEFRWEFVALVAELGNEALKSMGCGSVKGRALGTPGWRSDIDFELVPEEKEMPEAEQMLAKLIFDVIATQLLNPVGSSDCLHEAGRALDLEFYTEHYASRRNTFAHLSLASSQKAFYAQELIMAGLQRFRACGDCPEKWVEWKVQVLSGILEEEDQKQISEIFDQVEKFEELVERETLRQMVFEKLLKQKTDLGREALWREAAAFTLEELRSYTKDWGGKDSAEYKKAKMALKAGRLIKICQKIDEDDASSRQLARILGKDLQPSSEKEDPGRKEYEQKILQIALRSALCTCFFEEAVYTQAEYRHTVLAQKAQRKAERKLQKEAFSSSGRKAVLPRSFQAKGLAERHSSIISVQEVSAQLAHLLAKDGKRAQSPEQRLAALQKSLVKGSKYALREMDAFIQALKASGEDISGFLSLQMAALELEKCKRRKSLSQTGFKVLLQEALAHFKIKDLNVEVLVAEALALFAEGGALADDKAATKIPPRKKYMVLAGLFAEKGLKSEVFLERGGQKEVRIEDPFLDLILRAKSGWIDERDRRFEDLFRRSEALTLQGLNFETQEAIENYFSSLDRAAVFALQQTLSGERGLEAAGNLVEIWQSSGFSG